jgi:predicted transcriptional regulator of viral defense system
MTANAPLVHLRSQLRADGYADHEVSRLVHTGALAPVRRGAYVRGRLPTDPMARHLAQLRAATAQLGSWAVVSHVSAAVVHGWVPWAVPLHQVLVTRAARSGGRMNGSLHVRSAPLDPHEIDHVDGIAVTSPARTVVDVARSVPFEQAVVIADQALRAHSGRRPWRRHSTARSAGPGRPRRGV